MENLFSFISYVFVVTFTPGPNNIMSMINATQYGYKKTLRFMLGVFTGFFVLLLVSSFSNLLLLQYIPKIKPYMKVAGGLYMLYLAISILKPKKESVDKVGKAGTFQTGVLLQLVNVKAILYCITVISTFIIPNFQSTIMLIIFSFLLALTGFVSINCWALFGSFFNKYINKYEKTFNIAMALLLTYSALMITGLI